MAPRVAGTKRRGDASVSAPTPEGPASSQPSASQASPEAPQTNVPAPVAMMSPQEREFRGKLKELREHLIRNADYVGRRFPEEARKMHYGEIEHRSVYGEATPDRPRSCMRKESSFTRCPCCRTSGTDQRPTSTWSWPMHHLRFFDARITQPTYNVQPAIYINPQTAAMLQRSSRYNLGRSAVIIQ